MSLVFVLAAIIYIVVAAWIFFGTRKPGEVNVIITAMFSVFWPITTIVWFAGRKSNSNRA